MYWTIICIILLPLSIFAENTNISQAINEQTEQQQVLQEDENVTIEQVNLFPDKYVGKTFVFTQTSINQDIFAAEGVFAISVTSPRGKYIPGDPYFRRRDRIFFVIPESMAAAMSKEITGGRDWANCTIKCRIKKAIAKGRLNETVYLAIVEAIDVCTILDGKVSKSFRP